MSNHFSADNLTFPGDDRRLDLTDLFVFAAPASPEHHHALLHRHHPGTSPTSARPTPRPPTADLPPAPAARTPGNLNPILTQPARGQAAGQRSEVVAGTGHSRASPARSTTWYWRARPPTGG